jgi:hypothetical protein
MIVGAVATGAVCPVMGADHMVLVSPAEMLTDRSLMLYILLASKPVCCVFEGVSSEKGGKEAIYE